VGVGALLPTVNAARLRVEAERRRAGEWARLVTLEGVRRNDNPAGLELQGDAVADQLVLAAHARAQHAVDLVVATG
jgi:hypothetical protein